MAPSPLKFIKIGGVYRYYLDDFDDLINQKEVREILNIKSTTLGSWRRTGVIKHKKLGGMYFYYKKQINEFIE